ncbi:hypothetical protein ANO11243_066900 [Dothideomycetidae sp. 11243]|nr:hypothetical protein ANO11243_066900 [fungal sp. No.11243]
MGAILYLTFLLLACIGTAQAQQTVNTVTSVGESCVTQSPSVYGLSSSWVDHNTYNTVASTVHSTVSATGGVLTMPGAPVYTYALVTVTGGPQTTTSFVVATTGVVVTETVTAKCAVSCVPSASTCAAATATATPSAAKKHRVSRRDDGVELVGRAATATASFVATATFTIDCTVVTTLTAITTLGTYTAFHVVPTTITETSTMMIPQGTTTVHLTAFVTATSTATVTTSACKVCPAKPSFTTTKAGKKYLCEAE